jgi:hypothetical protein
MATTDVGYCNRALNLVGEDPIASFEDGTDRARTAALQYTRVRDMLLTMAVWNFARRKRQLSRLSTDPINEYQYQYQLPSDLLAGPDAVYNSSATGVQPLQLGWEIFGQTVYTNETTIYIDYRYRPDESRFPEWFGALLVLALAGAFAKGITDQNDLAALYNQQAFGTPSEGMRGGYFRTCTQINRQTANTLVVPSDELVAARFSL